MSKEYFPNTAHDGTLIIERTAKEYGELKPMAPHFINNLKFKMSDSLKKTDDGKYKKDNGVPIIEPLDPTVKDLCVCMFGMVNSRCAQRVRIT